MGLATVGATGRNKEACCRVLALPHERSPNHWHLMRPSPGFEHRSVPSDRKGDRVSSSNRILCRAGLVAGLTAALFMLAACGKDGAGDTASGAKGTAATPLLLSEEDLLTVRSNALSQGPVITGSVQPERRADLRAEISAVVLTVLKENGDPVKRGDLLVRLDDTSIRDTLTSATASERAAALAYEQAERQYQRMVKLRETGIVSAQQLEDTENRRNTAQSDKEAARARV